MEQCYTDATGSLSETCEDVLLDSLGSLETGYAVGTVDSVVLSILSAVKTFLVKARTIEVPSFQEYAFAVQGAIQASFHSIVAWVSVLVLIISPVWQLAAVFAKEIWPHVAKMTAIFVRFQASLPITAILAEAAIICVVVLLVLLRRFIRRRRYLPRAQQSIRLFRARVIRRYLALTASIERNFKLSAQAFPHVVYWISIAFVVWLAPGFAHNLRQTFWIWVTVTWPSLYALYLVLRIREQQRAAARGGVRGWAANRRASEVKANAAVRSPLARTPNSPAMDGGMSRTAVMTPRDVDKVLMYWVVFMAATCCNVLALYVPFAASVIPSVTPPYVRTASFFFVVWMHLPGPGSGLQVAYAMLEPLIRRYVKDLRTPGQLSEGALGPFQHVVVFLGIMTKERAEMIADSVVDSWMLLPTVMFFFTPSFLTNLGCLYAGLVVPALNSMKTIGRLSQTRIKGERATIADISGEARVRWLEYWLAFGGWWHVSWAVGTLLRVVPLSRHVELLFLLWLQVPFFRGAGKIIDIFEGLWLR